MNEKVIPVLMVASIAAGSSIAGEGRIPIFEPLLLDGAAGPISGEYINSNGWIGIHFDFDSLDNVYGRNVVRNNAGQISCDSQGAPSPCSSPAICDNGTGNTSYRDNMGPGPGC